MLTLRAGLKSRTWRKRIREPGEGTGGALRCLTQSLSRRAFQRKHRLSWKALPSDWKDKTATCPLDLAALSHW